MGPDVASGIAEAITVAGLDLAAVVDLVDRALAEDLDGGTDVTSVATVPAAQQGALDLSPVRREWSREFPSPPLSLIAWERCQALVACTSTCA